MGALANLTDHELKLRLLRYLQQHVQYLWPALENYQGRQAQLDSPGYCLAYLRLAFPEGASAQPAGLASDAQSDKRKPGARLTDTKQQEAMRETAPAGAPEQADAGSGGQSGQAAQQPGASSDVAISEADVAQREEGQPESARAPLGTEMAATSATAGQPAAAEEPQERTPAAGHPEQQSELAQKRQRRVVKPDGRAAGAAAEPVEDATASRQLAVLAPPRERGSTRNSLALVAIEQEGNDGQWDSTGDVEALRGAKQKIEGARKTKLQKLRADQERERRDLVARHKQAIKEVNEEAELQQADAVEAAVQSLQLKLMASSMEWQACQDAWRQAQGRLTGNLLERFAQELRITEECFRQQAVRELSADRSPEHKSKRRRKT